MQESRIILIGKALSDVNRVNIIKLIVRKELCACKLLEALDISQSTLSHHMKVLIEADLVNARKDGKWTHYSINKEQVKKIKEYLEKILEEVEVN